MEKTLNADDRHILSDKLENAGAMLAFLCAASRSLCEREEPLTAGELYGMMLAFDSLSKDIRFVQEFILKG